MRKVIINFFFLVACFFLWTASASAESTTVMVYMCGSNLESQGGAATKDIQEMLASRFDAEQVHLMILAGGSAQWQNKPAFPNDQLSLCTARNKSTGGVKLEQLSAWESRSMGDADTLAWFLQTCMEHSKTERYALVLWDHGGGPLGSVCLDEINDLDGLTIAELTEALELAGLQKKLDWIGFDACLMGSAEVALAVAPYAEYMIASQETEPADGWNYTFLKGIENDADGAETGKRIVDAYFSGRNASQYGITLSCTDLGAISGLTGAMNRFFGPITDKLDSHTFASLSELRTFREISSAPYEEDLNYNEIFAPAVLITDYAPDMPSPSVYLEVNGQPTYFDKFDIGQYSYFWYYCTSAYSGPGSYECVAYIDGVKCCSQAIEVRTVRTRAPTALESAHTGDMVLFGAYEQDSDPNNEKESVEWLVLDEEQDSLLLFSRYALEGTPYLLAASEGSDLAAWLNTSFINNAFSPEEQAIILPTDLRGDDEAAIDGSSDLVRDKVFLLNEAELERFFPDSSSRICYASPHAVKTASLTSTPSGCRWWLQPSHGIYAYVETWGEIYDTNGERTAGVRPAIRVQRKQPTIADGKSEFLFSY